MSTLQRITDKGFTLIEVVIAMLVLAVVTTAISKLNGNLFYQSTDIGIVQNNALLLQACADRIIGIRHSQGGYSALPTTGSNICSGISSTLSINTVALAQTCPLTLASNCTQLEIKVTGYNTPVTLYFVNY